MARRLIGTGTTDSNGRVTIEYTGTGAGRVQVTAETTDGSLSSETYSRYDVLFKDIVTEDDYTAWTYSQNTTISRASETTLTQTNTENKRIIPISKVITVT